MGAAGTGSGKSGGSGARSGVSTNSVIASARSRDRATVAVPLNGTTRSRGGPPEVAACTIADTSVQSMVTEGRGVLFWPASRTRNSMFAIFRTCTRSRSVHVALNARSRLSAARARAPTSAARAAMITEKTRARRRLRLT